MKSNCMKSEALKSLMKGLEILDKYEVTSMQGEHDVIYFLTKNELSEEDSKTMRRNEDFDGWHWSTDADSWGFFT